MDCASWTTPRRTSRRVDSLEGETAFKLYDTYGFPLDLTQDALRERGMTVDTDGFNAAMERQKAEARASWKGSGQQAEERVWFELRDAHGATEFLGYELESADGVRSKAIVVDGKPVEQARSRLGCHGHHEPDAVLRRKRRPDR